MKKSENLSRRQFLKGGAVTAVGAIISRLTGKSLAEEPGTGVRTAVSANDSEENGIWSELPLDILPGAYLVSDPEADLFGKTVRNLNFSLTQYIHVYPGLEIMLSGVNAANGRDGWVGYSDVDTPVIELWSTQRENSEKSYRKKILRIPDGIYFIRGSCINMGIPPKVWVRDTGEYALKSGISRPILNGYTEIKDLEIHPHKRKDDSGKFADEEEGHPSIGDVFFIPAGTEILFTVKNANIAPYIHSGDNYNNTEPGTEIVEQGFGFGFAYYRCKVKDVCNWIGAEYYCVGESTVDLSEDVLRAADPHLYLRFPGRVSNTQFASFTRTRGLSGDHNRLFTVVHLTDIHGDMDSTHAAFEYADQIGADFLALTGDNVPYRAAHGYNILHSMIKTTKAPIVYSVGNHDVNGSDANVYKVNITPIKDYIQAAEDHAYYFRDFKRNGEIVRVISLYPFYENAEKRTRGYYTGEQLRWLCETMSSVSANGHIFILRHFSHHKPVLMADDKSMFYDFNNSATESGLDFWLNMDRDPIPEIIDAYNKRISILAQYTGNLKEGTEIVAVDYDFSNRPNSEFVAYFTGHWHSDSIGYTRGTTTKQIELNSICTTGVKGNEGYHSFSFLKNPRDYGTDSQIAFNVFSFDFEKKNIYVARVGNGIHRNHTKTYMEFSYADR